MKRLLLVLALAILVGCARPQATPTPTLREGPASPGIPGSPAPTSSGLALTLLSTGPVTLDPALARDATSARFIVEVFSGLVSLDKDLRVVPELARSWDVSPDGKAYTFYLRQGARFHNGREVTAADFKYSIERAADPRTGSATAAIYLGDIVGVREKLAGKSEEVSGVQAVGTYTLKVTLDAPKAYFLKKLTHPAAMVVDRDNVEAGEKWWRHPNGSGPFKLKEWKEDELLSLEGNPGYYLGPPKLAYASFRLFAGIPMLLYEAGEIDIAPVAPEDLERVRDPANPLSQELVAAPTFNLSYVGFDHTRPPFDDPRVRLAFTQAIDREKLAALVFRGGVRPAQGILPPGFPGYAAGVLGPSFDPQKARELLAQSQYAALWPPLVFTTAGYGPEAGSLVSALADMWQRNLGVTIEQVRVLDLEVYFNKLKAEKDHLFDMGWLADYPDPENFLDILFHSQSPENVGEYSNPQVDGLLEAARVEGDEARRLALYRRAEQRVVEDAAILPLFFDVDYALVKPYVKGYALVPLPIPILKYVSLER